MAEWCAFCDFTDIDPDPEDCTCEEYCGEEGCSGDNEQEKDTFVEDFYQDIGGEGNGG